MIRMLTAYTTEIEEIDDAINDILGQIDVASLSKNSVGLMYCHGEFVESGIVRALCDRLSFAVIGMTAASTASQNSYGVYGLSLAVLTSDDIEFKTAFTEPLTESDYEGKIAATYSEACANQPDSPAFIISYLPYMNNLSGAQLANSLDIACGGIPIYGGVCYGINLGNEKSATIFNGETRADAIAMLLVYGAVKPQFNSVALPERYTRGDRAIITDSDGCILRKVNDTPILEYLGSVGYTVQQGAPLMVFYDDNAAPVALVIYMVFEDGSVLCGGEMPVGASIALGEINRDSILETTKEAIDDILNAQNKNGAIIFPCSVRYFALYPEQHEEMKLTSDALNGKIPYVMGYSGGELCPVPSENGILRNRFHNYTFCSCVF